MPITVNPYRLCPQFSSTSAVLTHFPEELFTQLKTVMLIGKNATSKLPATGFRTKPDSEGFDWTFAQLVSKTGSEAVYTLKRMKGASQSFEWQLDNNGKIITGKQFTGIRSARNANYRNTDKGLFQETLTPLITLLKSENPIAFYS